MSPATERTPFWKVPVGEALLWLLPALLAGMGHLVAWPKANLSDVGPGFHIINLNERTIRAQELWRLLSDAWWLFILYGCLLLGVHVVFRIRKVPVWIRIPAFGLMAIPGVWYLGEASYLGGKLIGL